MKELVKQINDFLAQDIEVLASIAQWIAMSVPVVEDGNNFGCDVQQHAATALPRRETREL